jgi:hypothetical protein
MAGLDRFDPANGVLFAARPAWMRGPIGKRSDAVLRTAMPANGDRSGANLIEKRWRAS